MRQRALLPGLAVLALAAGGCGLTGAVGPLPAGPHPSTISRMVCRPEAATNIGRVLGETDMVSNRTWVNHLYSCDNRFSTGTIVLSVKELSSWAQTLSYFHGLGRTLGETRSVYNLGQGAFQVRDGSVVVRKDWKVLLVDVSKLPPEFGVPPTKSSDVALTVADVILGCWSGD